MVVVVKRLRKGTVVMVVAVGRGIFVRVNNFEKVIHGLRLICPLFRRTPISQNKEEREKREVRGREILMREEREKVKSKKG